MHVDIHTCKPLGIYGYRYALFVIDNYSRCIFVRLLRQKSDALAALIDLCQKWYRMSSQFPARWRIDGTPNYNNFKKWSQGLGITFESTPRDTPKQNSRIERFQGFIIQMARTMLIASSLPPNLWPLATDSAAHIANRLIRPGHDKPPAQLWQEAIP